MNLVTAIFILTSVVMVAAWGYNFVYCDLQKLASLLV
jgi:hypothetical protein